jgi:hypothetical protein
MTYFDSLDDSPVERDGFMFTLSVEADDHNPAPWEENDDHGPVSDWTRRDKLPGELLLSDDNPSGLRSTDKRLFYDYAAACRIARRHQWGFAPGKIVTARNSGRVWNAWFNGVQGPYGTSAIDGSESDAIRALYAAHRATFPSARAYAAAAARADYERLRKWCESDWYYVGVIVTVSRNGIELASDSLWGIESDATDHLLETANELAESALDQAQQAIVALIAGRG